jgi:hypothetical protein
VDVKETETEERAKGVRKPSIRGVVQIRYGPGSCEYGDWTSIAEQLEPAGFKRIQSEERGNRRRRCRAGTKLGFEVFKILVAARLPLPQRGYRRLSSWIRTLGYSVTY